MAVNKGLYFSFDALIAALIVLGTVSMVAHTDFSQDIKTVQASYNDVDSAAEDGVQLMMRTELRNAVNTTEQSDLVNTTNLTEADLDRSVMDAVAVLWAAGEEEEASTLIEEFIGSQIPDDLGYRVRVEEGNNNSLIFSSGDGFDEASLVARSSRLVSGVSRDQPSEGYTASASLSSLSAINSEYFFFGGYVGDGNITANMSLPSYENIERVEMEADAGSNFTVAINDVKSGAWYNITEEEFRADSWTICTESVRPSLCEALEEGNNRIDLSFKGNASISGGFIRVRYNESYSLQSEGETYRVNRQRLPGINDVINYYGGFRVPGTLNSIDARLNFDASAEIAFRIGNATIFEGSGDQTLELSNSTIHDHISDANMSYEEMSNGTVPVRLGVDEIRSIPGVEGNLDAVGVTDVSGNMNANTDQGKKWELAKNATEVFIDLMGNATRARAGLTGFKDAMYADHPLTYDNASLQDELESWKTGSGTCVGCGILRMIGLQLEGQQLEKVTEPGHQWRYTTGEPDGDWTRPGYDTSSWNTGTLPLGNGSVAVTQTNESDSYYLRTSVDYPSSSFREPYLSLSAVGNVTAYLNGRKVTEYESGTGHHLNGRVGRWANRSGLWHRSDERTQVGNYSWYFGLPEVNHFATNEQENGHLTTPWLNLSERSDPVMRFSQWLDIDGNQNRHIASIQIDDGSGWSDLDTFSSSTTGWSDESYSLSSERIRVRFLFESNEEVSDIYEGWYLDNVSIAGFDGTIMNGSRVYDEAVLALRYNATDLDPQTKTHTIDTFGDGAFTNTTVDGGDLALETGALDGEYRSSPFSTPKYAAWNDSAESINEPDGTTVTVSYGTNETGSWVYEDTLEELPHARWYRYRVEIDRDTTDDDPGVSSLEATHRSAGRAVDALLEAQENRYRSSVVLSAGGSNSETELDNVETVTGDSTIDHSIEAACRAQENHDITVNAINFADSSDTDAETELQNIAECGGGEYYFADPDSLAEVYEQITKDILQATLQAQRIQVSGAVNDTLYADSWLDINYTTHKQRRFGEVRLTQESDRFGGEVTSPKNGSFMIPEQVRLADARLYTYSSQYWTDRGYIHNESTGWIPFYRLWKYNSPYEDLGEPFRFFVPPSLVASGEQTNLSIDASENQTAREGGSPDTRIVYDLFLDGAVGFGDVFNKSAGGNTTYDSIDGNISIAIGDTNDTWDPESDALDNAVDRLMQQLDVDNDGVIEAQIDEGDIKLNDNSIAGLRWLWGPATVSIEVWEE